jgi:hypothetical protein
MCPQQEQDQQEQEQSKTWTRVVRNFQMAFKNYKNDV